MYERFTDRARKVMQLANQQAQRYNHEYIGTEHILPALLIEGSGVAANVLKELGISLARLRLEIEKLVQPGPDMVTMGKLPQTPRTKKVIEYSMQVARELQHNYVGTEHILLGLVREKEGVAYQVLMNLGVNEDSVKRATHRLLGTPAEPELVVNLVPAIQTDEHVCCHIGIDGAFSGTLAMTKEQYERFRSLLAQGALETSLGITVDVTF